MIHRNGAKGFSATDYERKVDVSEKASKTINDLLPVVRDSIGSVEGRLEEISIHRRKKFVVYHAVTKKAVNCLFHDDALLDRVIAALGERVVVIGNVFSNAKAEPVRIDVIEFQLLDSSRRIPTTAELTGSDPNFTGDLSTDEFIRRIRHG